jgi:hypothetical protein
MSLFEDMLRAHEGELERIRDRLLPPRSRGRMEPERGQRVRTNAQSRGRMERERELEPFGEAELEPFDEEEGE